MSSSYVVCALLFVGCSGMPSSRSPVTLGNEVTTAVVDPTAGLTSLTEHGQAPLTVSHDSFRLNFTTTAASTVISPGNGCSNPILSNVTASSCVLTWSCTQLTVGVIYELRPNVSFVSKQLLVTPTSPVVLNELTVWDQLVVGPAALQLTTRSNPFAAGLEIAAFGRWPGASRGFFLSVANPFVLFTAQSGSISAAYSPSLNHDPSTALEPTYTSEHGTLGPTQLQKYDYSDGDSSFNLGEREAFIRCVESFLSDRESRSNRTVKVNVAWDENDYQIDAGSPSGQLEYKRIIDRNAQFGVTHVVYEPRNTLHASRFNSTDGWGWEAGLWFSMGEDIRELRWDPLSDEAPTDILEVVQYAQSKGVGLLAYVYPCLGFQAMKQHLIGGVLNIAAPEAQKWLGETLGAFMRKTGAQGFAWDHDIFAGGPELRYSQWRSWMQILEGLRAEFPEMVMDHRQTNHMWGPWYQIAGSYAEPIAGDENPETYGVQLSSLHIDHVSADRTRYINYIYSMGQMIPPSRIPGFAFHQTERTDDNGTNACFGTVELCYDMNARDFDLLGYRYSLLSTIGTAGQNNVLTMIPARDPEEFKLFPQKDLDFVQKWLQWTDEHLQYLQRTAPIHTLAPGPVAGRIDGTHSMHQDEGFLFLFNPNMIALNASLTLDEMVGLSNSSGSSSYDLIEIYPGTDQHLGTFAHSTQLMLPVGGSSVRVIQLTKHSSPAAVSSADRSLLTLPVLHHQGSSLQVSALRALHGSSPTVTIHSNSTLSSVSVNGVPCDLPRSLSPGKIAVGAKLSGGAPIYHAMPIDPSSVAPSGFSGGWFNTTFSIPDQIRTQLAALQKEYPVEWQPHEYRASWLVPSRLLMYPFVAGTPDDQMHIRMVLDGADVELTKAYTSRGLAHSHCFSGFYYDAANLTAESSHSMSLQLPPLTPGQFQGVFWENVQSEGTELVLRCQAEMVTE